MLRLKPGVRLYGIRPEAAVGIYVAASVFTEFGYHCIVTSVADGTHSHASLHYAGAGFDLRRRHVDDDDAEAVQDIDKHLRDALGDEFDVVLEDTHWHVEYQPKSGLNLE